MFISYESHEGKLHFILFTTLTPLSPKPHEYKNRSPKPHEYKNRVTTKNPTQKYQYAVYRCYSAFNGSIYDMYDQYHYVAGRLKFCALLTQPANTNSNHILTV